MSPHTHIVRVAASPFSVGDRVRLMHWAPSDALDRLNYEEQPPPGAIGTIVEINDLSRTPVSGTTHQIHVWWYDKGDGTQGETVAVCLPGDQLEHVGVDPAVLDIGEHMTDAELKAEELKATEFTPRPRTLQQRLWPQLVKAELERRGL